MTDQPTGLSGEEAISAVFDAHMAAEFVERDIDATMATMVSAPYVNHVPVMTVAGITGRYAVSIATTSSPGGRPTHK